VKKFVHLFVWTSLALTFLTSCSDDRSDNLNVSCDGLGNCIDTRTGFSYNNRYGNGFGFNNGFGPNFFNRHSHNPNAVILSGRLEYIENPKVWEKVQIGLGICSDKYWFGAVDDCIQALPTITVVFDNYRFNGPEASSRGSFLISPGYSNSPGFNVTWRTINGGTGFDTQVNTPFDRSNRLRIQIIGRPTDSAVRFALFYGPASIGSGILYRVNRPR
jgi:hypothetical protein